MGEVTNNSNQKLKEFDTIVAGKYTDYTTKNKIICDSNRAHDVGGLNYVISR